MKATIRKRETDDKNHLNYAVDYENDKEQIKCLLKSGVKATYISDKNWIVIGNQTFNGIPKEQYYKWEKQYYRKE